MPDGSFQKLECAVTRLTINLYTHDGREYAFPVLGVIGGDIRLGFFFAHSNPTGRDAVDIFDRIDTTNGGLPVVAIVGGWLVRVDNNSPKSGYNNRAQLTLLGDDGLEYYYTHLRVDSPIEFEIQNVSRSGTRVRVEAGQLIGRIGNDKESDNTAPHLHISARDPLCTRQLPLCGIIVNNDDGTQTIYDCITDRHAGRWLHTLLWRFT
jgi:hypothetical protein